MADDATNGGSVFVNFSDLIIEFADKELAILVWDASLNNGQGGWVELPATLICCQDGVTYDGNRVRYEIQSISSAGDGWLNVVVQVNCYKNGQAETLYEFTMKVKEEDLDNGLQTGRNNQISC